MKVREMMSFPVRVVSSDKSVQYASELMAELKMGSLVVMDHATIMGIITSRDARKAHPNRIVADAMTADPIWVTADSFGWDALHVMEDKGIERLLVADNDEVIGIVTRDIIKIHLSELQDPLTGLYRPGYVQSIGEDLLQKQQYFQLLFMDLNNFGKINKIYGHPVGDDVIKGFADRIRSLMMPSDFLCRYAGDEFVMVSLREDSEMDTLVKALSEPFYIGEVYISAAVGVVLGSQEPQFFSFGFRDIVSKASLLSTSIKHSV